MLFGVMVMSFAEIVNFLVVIGMCFEGIDGYCMENRLIVDGF
jgi:hypothetical protein